MGSVRGGFQTTLLNYRLMKTLREMKSLSDRATPLRAWYEWRKRIRWVVESLGSPETCMAERRENCRPLERFRNFYLRVEVFLRILKGLRFGLSFGLKFELKQGFVI